jgi:FKBP-type peptidyl-prolyl cis-trans isomerase 2
LSRPSLRILLAVVALIVLAAACGDDDGVASTQAESPNTQPFGSTTAAPAPTTEAPTTVPPTTVPQDPGRTVENGDAISVHYVGTLDDGEQFDSSRDRNQPLSFVVGSGQLIRGFDTAVMGMKIGDVKTVRIEAVDAYGERVEMQTVSVPLEQLPDDVAVGQTLFNGAGQEFTVLELGETEASLEFDPNHPLAGEALTFEIELVSFDS